MEDTLAQVRAAYDRDPEREWRRLESKAQYRLEHLVTMYALKRHLPVVTQDRPCHVLDAGGGPGRYTLALAAQGYTMSLCDLSPALLALARQRIAESAPAVRERVPAVVEGSITDLSRFGDEQFDAVLCLGGVLSHVIEDALRRQALAELRRVAKPGRFIVHRGDESAGRLPLDRAVAELLHTILSAPAGDGYHCHRPWSRADVLLSPGGNLSRRWPRRTSNRCGCMAATVWEHIFRKITSTH